MDRLNTSVNNILIIDDLNERYSNLNNILLSYSITSKIVNNTYSAFKEIELKQYNCYFVSAVMKGEKTVQVIDKIKLYYPGSIVVLVTDNPSVELLSEYIRYGIDDILIFPFQWEKIEELLTFYNY
jgi:DNA-binding NtrC family response regulator